MLLGFKFLLNFQSAKKNVASQTSYFEIENNFYVFKHYSPVALKSKKSIVIFPGFSVHGFKDERLANLAKAIASVGYNVFIPQIEKIENLEIDESIIQEMTCVINYLSKHKKYSESNKIAVLAPSFSAGMLLKAAENQQISSQISSICTIGTFANIDTCLSFVLYKNQIDDYARNIILKNFISYTNLPNKELLKDLLKIAIEDNGFKRTEMHLPKKLQNIDIDIKLQWLDLLNNIEFRRKLFSDLKNRTTVVDQLQKTLNVIDCVDKYDTPLILIHGKKDDVIPPEESIQIYNKRKEKSLPSLLCITDLLSHGDSKISISNIKEIWQLSNAFSYFFKYAK